jgi:hypothetical protein
MKTTKVKQIESYKDSQVDTIVCKGKLVLIPATKEEVLWNRKLPIIISETEKILAGDKCLMIDKSSSLYGQIDTHIGTHERNDQWAKILALPEQFSPKHLQAMVDGKLKDGDEVYVECEVLYYSGGTIIEDSTYVKFNEHNNIKLFPVKQSVEDAIQNYEGLAGAFQDYVELYWEEYNEEIVKAIKYGIELAKKNSHY